MRQLARGVRPSLLAAVIAALLTACGAAGGTQPAAQTPAGGPASSPSAGQQTPAQVPLRTPPTNEPRTLVVRDQDNGHAVSIRVGERLSVVLASTYWQLDSSSNPTVLRPLAPATVSPQPGGCVPGGGCGAVNELFEAAAAGRADVTAKRTTCGEALSCTGNQGLFRITVVVAG
jgi:hypothetical protein